MAILARSMLRAGALWRDREFLKLWIGQTISQVGSRITRDGLPYTAVLMLHAGPLQMGLLSAGGRYLGMRFTLTLAALGIFASGMWLVFSPIRGLKGHAHEL